MNERTNEPTIKRTYERMSERTNEQTDKRMNEQTNVRSLSGCSTSECVNDDKTHSSRNMITESWKIPRTQLFDSVNIYLQKNNVIY
jgi:hypothetical protein